MRKANPTTTRKTHRILAMVMALMMVMGSLGVTAFADDSIPTGDGTPGTSEDVNAPDQGGNDTNNDSVTTDPTDPTDESTDPAQVTDPAPAKDNVEQETVNAPTIRTLGSETISADKLAVTLSGTSFVYTGKAIAPTATTVTFTKEDSTTVNLTEGTDYTVTYTYTNNIKIGTATVTMTFTGQGEYAGEATINKNFNITKANIKNVTVTGLKTRTYKGGKAITQSPTLKYNGVTLKKGTDYTVSYKNNKKIGTATITFTGAGNFKGTLQKKFKIVSRTATSFNWNGYTLKTKTPVQLDRSLRNANRPPKAYATGQAGKIKLTWKKAGSRSDIDGYIILRKDRNSKVYKEIAKVSKNRVGYIDTTANKNNCRYNYTLVGYKKDGKSIRISPCTPWVTAVTTGSRLPNGYNVILNKKTVTLQKGEKVKLRGTYKVKVHDTSIRWYSDNAKIAAVNKKTGVVTAKAAGTTKIRAKLGSGREMVCKVTVLNSNYKKQPGGYWIISGNSRYYASPAGPIYTNTFFKVGGYYYYAGKTGAVVKTRFSKYGYTLTPNSSTGAITPAQYQAMLNKKVESEVPWIEVSLSKQTLYVHKGDRVVFTSQVVTGKPSTPTVTGNFKVYLKARNQILRGPNEDGTRYEVPVSFWMPFYGGYGLHDIVRYAWGGNVYQYAGSHGCVNLPYNTASKLWYDYVKVGTRVYIHW